MTIQSINAYTPPRPSDPSLNRTWVTKDQFNNLEAENEELRSKVEELEGDIHELTKWRKGVEIGMQQLWEQFGL